MFETLVDNTQTESELKILAPPTSVCYDCDRQLVGNHNTQVWS